MDIVFGRVLIQIQFRVENEQTGGFLAREDLKKDSSGLYIPGDILGELLLSQMPPPRYTSDVRSLVAAPMVVAGRVTFPDRICGPVDPPK